MTCLDTEWLCPIGPDGKPDYSRVVPCHCKIDREKSENLRSSLDRSGIPDTRKLNTFETFKRITGTEEAFGAAKVLAGGVADFVLLLIYGGPGNGKTHLAYAACLHAIEAGRRAIFKPILELFTQLRMAMDNKDLSPDMIIEEMKQIPFLVLDDLGAQPTRPDGSTASAFQESKIEELVNFRYAHRKPLIITMNRDPSTLPEPILSRFKDPEVSRMIQNQAADFRRRKGG